MHSFCLTACAFWACCGLETRQCLVVAAAVGRAGYSLVLDYPQIFFFDDPPPGVGTVTAEDSDWALKLWLQTLLWEEHFLEQSLVLPALFGC